MVKTLSLCIFPPLSLCLWKLTDSQIVVPELILLLKSLSTVPRHLLLCSHYSAVQGRHQIEWESHNHLPSFIRTLHLTHCSYPQHPCCVCVCPSILYVSPHLCSIYIWMRISRYILWALGYMCASVCHYICKWTAFIQYSAFLVLSTAQIALQHRHYTHHHTLVAEAMMLPAHQEW